MHNVEQTRRPLGSSGAVSGSRVELVAVWRIAFLAEVDRINLNKVTQKFGAVFLPVTWKYKNISLLAVKTNMLIVLKSQIVLKVTPHGL